MAQEISCVRNSLFALLYILTAFIPVIHGFLSKSCDWTIRFQRILPAEFKASRGVYLRQRTGRGWEFGRVRCGIQFILWTRRHSAELE